MRTPFVLLGLVLLLVAGLLWLLADGGSPGSAPEAPTRGSSEAGPAAQTAERLVPASAAEVGTEAERLAADDERRSVAAAKDPKPAQLAVPDLDHPELVGRVLDAAGAPVAGARVLAGEAGSWLQASLDTQSDKRETETDAAGRFRLAGLEAGKLRLGVRASGFAPFDLESLSLPRGKQHDVGDLRLVEGLILSGIALDLGGAPVAGAEFLRWEEEDVVGAAFGGDEVSGAVLARSEADGSFLIDVLQPGRWTVLAQHADHPNQLLRGEGLEVGVAQDLVVRFEPGYEIHGRVVRPEGKGVRGLLVRASPVELDEPAGEDPLPWREVASDETGAFRLGGLRAGTYRLRARTSSNERWNREWRTPSVEVRAGAREVELVMDPPTGLQFRLVDAKSGAAVTDFKVTVDARGENWSRDEDMPAQAFVVEAGTGLARTADAHIRSSAVRVGISIAADGYIGFERGDVEFEHGSTIDLGTIELKPVDQILVQVVDARNGAPVPEARLRVHEVEDGPGKAEVELAVARSVGKTDAAGRKRVPVFGDHGYWITVDARAYLRSGPVRIAAASEPIVVELGKGATLSALVVDGAARPVPGLDVECTRTFDSAGKELEHEGALQVTADTEGRALFEGLAPGTYSLRVRPETSPWSLMHAPVASTPSVEVVLGADDEREVRLLAPGRGELLGRVSESGRPLVGARLRLEPDRGESDQHMFMFPGSSPGATTDGQGRFQFEPAPVGQYRLTIDHPTRAMSTFVDVTLIEGRNERDVQLFASAIEGRVTDEAGRPLPGLLVTVSSPEIEMSQAFRFTIQLSSDEDAPAVTLGSGEQQSAVYTDADGRYRLHGVVPGPALIVLVTGDWVQPARSKMVTVERDETKRDVDLIVRDAGALRVRKLDESDTDWSVAIELGKETRIESLDGSGGASFDGLPPGLWRVVLRNSGTAIASQEAEVVVGETTEVVF